MDLKQYIKPGDRGKDSQGSKILELYRFRLSRLKHVRVKRSVLLAAAVILLAAVVFFKVWFHVDQNYQVLSTVENEDTQSSDYVKMGDSLLKYGNEGVTLISQAGTVLWSQNYEMSNPDCVIRGETAVIYDRRGTSIYVVDKEGTLGSVNTKFPILKVDVSQRGSVGAILEDGERTWVNYYASDGSTIVENQTRMENTGYPLDLAVSPGGEVIGVSFLNVEEGEINSRVVFYNFGDQGQDKEDNIVSEFTYQDTLVPEIFYLDQGTCVAFRDDGFSVYQGESVPEESADREAGSEIVSTFHDEEYFGMVVNGDSKEEPYIMKLYDASGREKFSRGFEQEYESISISGERILLFDAQQVQMYDLSGRLEFDGKVKEGAVKRIFQMAKNRYLLVSENGIETIKLKW